MLDKRISVYEKIEKLINAGFASHAYSPIKRWLYEPTEENLQYFREHYQAIQEILVFGTWISRNTSIRLMNLGTFMQKLLIYPELDNRYSQWEKSKSNTEVSMRFHLKADRESLDFAKLHSHVLENYFADITCMDDLDTFIRNKIKENREGVREFSTMQITAE